MFAGSRTTPTVDGEHVYTVGPMGDLHAINIETRKPAWRANIWKDFGGGAELPRWAIVQNPLIYGDLLIVAPQTPEVGVVGLRQADGRGPVEVRRPVRHSRVRDPFDRQGRRRGSTRDDHRAPRVAAATPRTAASTVSIHAAARCCGPTPTGSASSPFPQAVDAGEGRVLITGAYGAGSAMIKVEKKSDGTYGVSELFKNPDFGAHTQPPVLHDGHFYSHYTINERSDGLVAMSMDGQIKWKTDQQPPFVRGGSILADGLMLMTDGSTKLYLIEPSPAGFKPLASAVILEPGDNWAPLALVDGKLLVRGQKELKALQVAQ